MRCAPSTMNDLLSVYQHPTLTLLLDDSPSFLDSLAFQLSPHLARKTFHDARSALNWLHHAHLHSIKNRKEPIRVGYDEQSESFERRSASINLERIYHIVTERHRFDMPAVVVVDYAMPQMDGLEFCEAIRRLPCKKILLTGQADEKVAIDAFNRKLIDRFIRKNDTDAMNRLENEIVQLQEDFFIGQTSTLKDLLSRHSYAFLADPAIVALAEQLCKRYRFVEYYVFPHPTGILFLDTRGKATLMVIETAAGLTTQFEVAQDQGAPSELLAALKELRLVPFFSDTGGMYENAIGHDWTLYCLPAQVCRGWHDYYWALFDLPHHYLPGPVYSYAEFLQGRTVG